MNVKYPIVKAEEIAELVCKVSGIPLEELKKKGTKKRVYVRAKVAMAVCNSNLKRPNSYTSLGKVIGRDHSTIHHYLYVGASKFSDDREFKSIVAKVSDTILLKEEKESIQVDEVRLKSIEMLRKKLQESLEEKEALRSELRRLQVKVDNLNVDVSKSHLLAKLPEEYRDEAEERIDLVIRSIMSRRTHENTDRSEFNIKPEKFKTELYDYRTVGQDRLG